MTNLFDQDNIYLVSYEEIPHVFMLEVLLASILLMKKNRIQIFQ
jgi:hypothetical protein